jgi:hypothetical protein
MKTQIPAVEQAEEELHSFDEKAKAERLAYEEKLAAAHKLGAQYRLLRETEDAASSRLTHALDKIDLLRQRIRRESEFLLNHLPHHEFSKGFFKAMSADPLESQAGLYIKWGGEHPYVYTGKIIAASQAVVELFTSALPGLEAEAAAAKSALNAFTKEHGSF